MTEPTTPLPSIGPKIIKDFPGEAVERFRVAHGGALPGELLPCPHCGQDEASYRRATPSRHEIECLHCGSRSPATATQEGARTVWNARTASPSTLVSNNAAEQAGRTEPALSGRTGEHGQSGLPDGDAAERRAGGSSASVESAEVPPAHAAPTTGATPRTSKAAESGVYLELWEECAKLERELALEEERSRMLGEALASKPSATEPTEARELLVDYLHGLMMNSARVQERPLHPAETGAAKQVHLEQIEMKIRRVRACLDGLARSSTAPSVPLSDILRTADHIEQNGMNVAKFGGEEVHEGRCRREFVSSYHMGERLKELDLALAAPLPETEPTGEKR